MLSALAGGGLTAVSLGGPLTGGALGSALAATTTTTPEGSSTPMTTADPGTGPREAAAGQPSSSTSTTPISPSTPKGTGVGTKPRADATPSPAPEAPTVVLQRRQRTTAGKNPAVAPAKPTAGPHTTATTRVRKKGAASGPNNVALPPQLAAGQAASLAAALASSAASAQALAFYRIPLFLLPVYQAAAAQYGVPWQILAAINEIETNYGSDQSVSTAGAVGWMQFMPATWLQYGVDALNAGYADPYNPVDAIFAAARYLRAAGAANDLRGAILAYNHSDEYANSVLLRAKLISTYPKPVLATLTGLVDDRPPVTGRRVAWGSLPPAALPSPASATANSVPVAPAATGGASGARTQPGSSAAATKPPTTPGPSAPPSPAAAAAVATGSARAGAPAPRLVELLSAPNASVVAVQDGQIVRLGSSRKLGRYVVLRDIYGDVFTYAGLGSIAPDYRLPKPPRPPVTGSLANAASAREPAPSRPATAGHQLPLTLHVKTPVGRHTAGASTVGGSVVAGAPEPAPAGMGKVRLFAHPGNPDARAASAARRARWARRSAHVGSLPLLRGSVVAKGTVLGHVRVPPGAKDGHLRFAIRPAGDALTIDPRPILSNWAQLDVALHPRGAKGDASLLGATTSEVLLMSKSRLEREVLSDPGIVMPACSRREVAGGSIDKRVLAALAFLSRSGLKPTVGTLRCGAGAFAVSGYVPVAHIGDGVAITRINDLPVVGHQGLGSVTDTAIRTLLTLRGEFAPHRIVSLMQYRDAPTTLARPDHGGYIELVFSPRSGRAAGPKSRAPGAAAAHSAGTGRTPPPPLAVSGELSAAEWDKLIARIASLPAPTVSTKASSSAIADPKRP
jgi:Transglycosylase SLT domain